MSEKYQKLMTECEAGDCKHSLGGGALTSDEILSDKDGPYKKKLPGLDENGNPLSQQPNIR